MGWYCLADGGILDRSVLQGLQALLDCILEGGMTTLGWTYCLRWLHWGSLSLDRELLTVGALGT